MRQLSLFSSLALSALLCACASQPDALAPMPYAQPVLAPSGQYPSQPPSLPLPGEQATGWAPESTIQAQSAAQKEQQRTAQLLAEQQRRQAASRGSLRTDALAPSTATAASGRSGGGTGTGTGTLISSGDGGCYLQTTGNRALARSGMPATAAIPQYQTTEARQLVTPGRQEWRPGRGPVERQDATGAWEHLVEVAPVYQTVARGVSTAPVPAASGGAQAPQSDYGQVMIPVLCSTQVTTSLVRKLQSGLIRAGYNPGAIDGKLGPKTLAALAKYQTAQGLAPIAPMIEPATLASLGVKPD